MTLERYYVALDENGTPFAQRTTLRQSVYISASRSGSFSSRPVSRSHPFKVVETSKAVEWVARAILEDGTKVSERSRARRIGMNYVLYSYSVFNEKEPRQAVAWTNFSAEGYAIKYPLSQVLKFAAGKVEIRNWPANGGN